MLGMSELTDSRGTVDVRASLAIAGGAAMWGLFWIPLRYVSDAGLGPMWAAALTLCGGLPFAFMAVVLFARKDRKQWPWMVVFGLGMGMSATLYFVSVIMTDVVRAIFLFYMLPIWTTLFDRAVFGIRLDIARAFSVIIAFAGLWLLLGGDGGVPLPRNAGDWAALGAGFCWGITLSLVRSRPAVDPHMSVFSSVLFASTFSMLAALLITGGGPNVPGSAAMSCWSSLPSVHWHCGHQ
jgi:drug/metabolite transporter (DMT)-like permease